MADGTEWNESLFDHFILNKIHHLLSSPRNCTIADARKLKPKILVKLYASIPLRHLDYLPTE